MDDIAKQQKETKEKINKLKWLETVESNKLYKNQQKLENATNSLTTSKSEIAEMQKKLYQLESRLSVASSEYNSLNQVLAEHIRNAYKSQRNARFQILLNSDDINMLVDRWYYQKVILQQDEERMLAARNKAAEIASIRNNIQKRKRNLERSVASMNTQQDYIKRAIARNEDMINKLRTDRAAYQKAERDLAHQSQQLSNYINRTASKTPEVTVAAGFMKPIQGRITSPFGWRTHPIFNTRTFHSGVDIGGPNLGAIKASNSGKVIYTGWYGGYGKVVIVEHGMVNGKPVTTLYAHMSSIAVANGTKVQRGQVLGYEGTTGYSTGPHCHFEVRVNGQPNNPLSYIGT
jgi:murein DD-endopeptidase MepM/ murein hydrolase activator NlpD